MLRVVKGLVAFSILYVVTVVANINYLLSGLVYPEEPLIYIANQNIHHFSDLIDIYLKPILFHPVIPFFRPSGHFLIYQIVTPFTGWLNMRAFLLINYFFMALTGYMMIRIYRQLFHPLCKGGYVAFAIILMHPALVLSKLVVLHFEFAYTFFMLLSLTLFIDFCEQKNKAVLSFKFLGVITFYMVAVTFKEPALMMGPVLAIYYLLNAYEGEAIKDFVKKIATNKVHQEVIFIITLVSVMAAAYISLPVVRHDSGGGGWGRKILGFFEFMRYILCFPLPLITNRHAVLSYVSINVFSTVVMLFLVVVTSLYCVMERINRQFVFLASAFFMFLVMPVMWGRTFPWHLSASLLFLALLFGYMFEFTLKKIFIKKQHEAMAIGTLMVVAMLATGVGNYSNAQMFLESGNREYMFGYALRKSALIDPPNIQSSLTDKTLLVIENSQHVKAYNLDAGNDAYYFLTDKGDNMAARINPDFYYTSPIGYGSNLFRWVYQKPRMREEMVPIDVSKLDNLPKALINHWLHYFDNIVCLGYDDDAIWHDKTITFKDSLMREAVRRKMLTS